LKDNSTVVTKIPNFFKTFKKKIQKFLDNYFFFELFFFFLKKQTSNSNSACKITPTYQKHHYITSSALRTPRAAHPNTMALAVRQQLRKRRRFEYLNIFKTPTHFTP
jgi:hypothetical protein